MGAAVSKEKHVQNIINESTLSTIAKITSTATTTAEQKNIIDISDSTGVQISDVDQRNVMIINMRALLTSANNGNLQRSLKNQLKGQIEAQQKATTGFTYNDAELDQTIRNSVNTTFSVESVARMIATYNQTNKLIAISAVGGRVENVYQENKIKSIMSLVNENSSKIVESLTFDTGAKSDIKTIQEADAIKSFFDGVASIFSGPFILILSIVVFVVVVGIVYKMSKKDDSSMYPQYRYQSQPTPKNMRYN